jgi:hypothetical protein
MSATLLVKAKALRETVAAVRVVAAAQQDAARLNKRLNDLQSTLADLRRAQAVFGACRDAAVDSSLASPSTGALAASVAAFGTAYEEQGDIDRAALLLAGAMNAMRVDLRAKVEAWWPPYAEGRIRDAGADAIDLLAPDDQAEARGLLTRLREATEVPPKIPSDVATFHLNLASLSELVAENQVADLPEQLRQMLRAVGARQLRLSDLTCESLELLNEGGYADRLSVVWG